MKCNYKKQFGKLLEGVYREVTLFLRGGVDILPFCNIQYLSPFPVII